MILSIDDVHVDQTTIDNKRQVVVCIVDFLSFFLKVKRGSISRLFQTWKTNHSDAFGPYIIKHSFPKLTGPYQLAFAVSSASSVANAVASVRRITKHDPWKSKEELASAFMGAVSALVNFHQGNDDDSSDKENKSSVVADASSSSSAKSLKSFKPPTKAPRLPTTASPHDNKSIRDSDLYHRLQPRLIASYYAAPPLSSASLAQNLVDLASPPRRRSPRKRASLGRSPLRSSALAALTMYNSDDDDLTDTE